MSRVRQMTRSLKVDGKPVPVTGNDRDSPDR
jgi:hypothetical protein